MDMTLTDEKLLRYQEVTTKALDLALRAPKPDSLRAEIILDMASRYVSDAKHFLKNGDGILAFAALNYAHGWLDTGARLGFFTVSDNQLFTVD